MKTYSITSLGRMFGLSRSTLLYYDRINLLKPMGRTPTGYRIYTPVQADRLARICHFRNAGLTLKQIREILSVQHPPSVEIIADRLNEIEEQIQALKAKQFLLKRMLQGFKSGKKPLKVDKKVWVEMLQAAGMDDNAMVIWHSEFERRAPQAHHQFLALLDLPENEILEIRAWAEKKLNDFPIKNSDSAS